MNNQIILFLYLFIGFPVFIAGFLITVFYAIAAIPFGIYTIYLYFQERNLIVRRARI